MKDRRRSFEATRRVSYGALVDADGPRFLAKAVGYTASSEIAMDKLECVDEAQQQRQTADAHRRWKREQQREWGKARLAILAGVERFKVNGHPDSQMLSDLRVVQRVTARIDQRIGLE
jgi:uncharacterized protein involved in type VI secretion and phage assembly